MDMQRTTYCPSAMSAELFNYVDHAIHAQQADHASLAGSVAWADVTGKPATYPPSGHHTSHEFGGSDIISLSSLRGVTIYVDHIAENTGAHTITLNNDVTASGNITLANTKDLLSATGGGSDVGSPTNYFGSIYATTHYADHIAERTGSHTIIFDNVLGAPAGTAAAPSYSFSGDTNTGMYSYSGDQIGFSSGGSLSARFDGTGLICYHTAGTATQYAKFGRSQASSSAVGFDLVSVLDAANCTFVSFINNSIATPIVGNRTHQMRWYWRNTSGQGCSLIGLTGRYLTTGAAYSDMSADLQIYMHPSGDSSTYPDVLSFHFTSTGEFRVLNGAVGTPAFSFINDTNSGMYYIGSDNYGFSAGGSLISEIKTTGFYSTNIFVDHVAEKTGAHTIVIDSNITMTAAKDIIAGSTDCDIGTEAALFGNICGTNFYNAKIRITPEGGYAVKLTNKTGGNSVKGQIVIAASGTDNAFATAAADEDMPIGIVYNAGIADGQECWVVIAGRCEVLVDAGGATRGYVLYCGTTGGSATASATVPAITNHMREVGHALTSRADAGLVFCITHYN